MRLDQFDSGRAIGGVCRVAVELMMVGLLSSAGASQATSVTPSTPAAIIASLRSGGAANSFAYFVSSVSKTTTISLLLLSAE
jgi:hypothetical protein